MKSKNYNYDVALSFAEEDKDIAEQIAASCKTLGLKPYFYEYENAENWGENLFNVIVNRYRDTAKFALILISKHYVNKKWTDIERQIIQSVNQQSSSAYLLPLRLDDTVLEGLTDNTLYIEWKENPKAIAEMIEQKIADLNQQLEKKNLDQDSKTTNIHQDTYIEGNAGPVFTIGTAGDISL